MRSTRAENFLSTRMLFENPYVCEPIFVIYTRGVPIWRPKIQYQPNPGTSLKLSFVIHNIYHYYGQTVQSNTAITCCVFCFLLHISLQHIIYMSFRIIRFFNYKSNITTRFEYEVYSVLDCKIILPKS